jgi:hypothetical protein
MLIMPKVNNPASRYGGKTFRRFKVGGIFPIGGLSVLRALVLYNTLHLYGADKIFTEPRSEPLFYPLKKPGRIAGGVAEKPVDGANVFRL